MIMRRSVTIWTLALIFPAVFADFTMTILHTNDVHSRFLSYDKNTRACNESNTDDVCWGGAARRLTAVKHFRATDPNVILLDGGDQFQGTIWFTAIGPDVVAPYMNLMHYDAVSFGNHEFDRGVETLALYLEKLNTPLINSNIRDTGSRIKNLFRNYTILERGGEKIGIIGYLTTETPEISSTGAYLVFEDEVEALQRAAAYLTSVGVNKIIAIGHAGINMDRQICQKVGGVDVVVGGHTNTFLYTGTPLPSTETPEGPYPEQYDNHGQPCLVVQDFAFGKYLGRLKVTFDKNGRLTEWRDNNPVLIDRSFQRDEDMVELLAQFQHRLDNFTKTVVGVSAVALDGERKSCRLRECNLGNLLADAAVHYYISKYNESGLADEDGMKHWTKAAIGLWNGGGIRDYTSTPWSVLTLEDIYTMMPFGNTIQSIVLKGRHLKEALEHGVTGYNKEDALGRFLQVSGLQVTYDLSKPVGHRVRSLLARCADCPVPVFEPIRMDGNYTVVTITYLKDGGDGFAVLRDNLIDCDNSEVLDIDVVNRYVEMFRPIATGQEGRIRFVDSTSCVSDPISGVGRPATTVHRVLWWTLVSLVIGVLIRRV